MASTSLHIRDYHTEIPGKLVDNSVWQFPTIDSVNAHGRKTFWSIYVKLFKMSPEIVLPDVPADAFIHIEQSFFDSKPLDPMIFAWINVDSGIAGGKIKKSVPTIVRSGKNLSSISATNTWTQALRNAYGIYNKQLKKASVMPGQNTELFPPMLAQVLKDQKLLPEIDVDRPAYVQRKYNGVRTIATLNDSGQVIMYSRRKNLYPGFAYIKAELLPVLRQYRDENRQLYLDGEIYKHGEPLQTISGYARREDQPEDIKYNYMIYDCFLPGSPELLYSERRKILNGIFAIFHFKYAQRVETFEVISMDEINELYQRFLAEDYEGAMIRFDKPYQYSHNERHSKVLLKMKPSYDHEFTVIEYTTGDRGKAAAALMIVCQTTDGKRFPVTPAMELPERIALAKKMGTLEPNGKTHFENHWLGKKIIVTYDEKSKDDIPQRARTRLEQRTWD